MFLEILAGMVVVISIPTIKVAQERFLINQMEQAQEGEQNVSPFKILLDAVRALPVHPEHYFKGPCTAQRRWVFVMELQSKMETLILPRTFSEIFQY